MAPGARPLPRYGRSSGEPVGSRVLVVRVAPNQFNHMEEVEKYLENIDRMHRFVEAFTALARQRFDVREVTVAENAQWGGPLMATYVLGTYVGMPSVEELRELTAPLCDFPFTLQFDSVQDPAVSFPGQEPTALMCFFCVAVDYGTDVYFIRKSDDLW